ncbi:DUF1878 domain-containing protein [Bacillus subtilis]|uniref:DUF1878 domain-containing protein n=1 Tax=Bacillus subtilis TaxID=1423 RepID=UPI00207C23ED|nr:DUF1878 domain-containing protein [Bacillus subtilis]
MNQELLDRLDLIEFRQELLFDDTSFSRLLFEMKVTRKQHRQILDLFDSLRDKVDNAERISSSAYESKIYEIVPQCQHSYHFAESVAQTLHEEGRWEEVFEGLYGDVQKFQHYLNNK